MVLVGNEEEEVQCTDQDRANANGYWDSEVNGEDQEKRTRAIVSSETASILGSLGKGPLDVRIRRLADERDDLNDAVRRLKLDLEEERQRNQRLEKMAPSKLSPEETEWETKKLIDDYKFKLQKAEQDSNTLQTNVKYPLENKINPSIFNLPEMYFNRLPAWSHRSSDIRRLQKLRRGPRRS